MPAACKLDEARAAGRTAFGVWAALGDPLAAELMCIDGVDYVCIDQQHGLADQEATLHMLRAIEARGVAALVRVVANDAALIGRALDFGAAGVIVPMVNSAAEARRAVTACRYAPHGTRSWGPTRATIARQTMDPRRLGDEVLCMVMAETPAALANIREIAATEGLDGIYIGPADLALGSGLDPQVGLDHPQQLTAFDAVLSACQDASRIAGIQCTSGAAAARMAARGFRLVTFAKDNTLLSAGIAREVAALHTPAAAAAAPASVGIR